MLLKTVWKADQKYLGSFEIMAVEKDGGYQSERSCEK